MMQEASTVMKVEEVKIAKRSGGRPQSEGWALYEFSKVEGDKGKCLAKCMKCLAVLKNTSIARMANHRKRCGLRVGASPGDIHKLIQSKIEVVEEVDEPPVNSTILWTSTGEENLDEYVDESVQPDKINRAATENAVELGHESSSDIKRHRKSFKSKSDSQTLDAALSSFLIGCNLTFDIVDSPHFKKFVSALNHSYNMPSSSQLKARVLSQLKAMETPDKSRPSKKRRYYETSEDDSE